MLSRIFRRRTSGDPDTFNERVNMFGNWFARMAPAFYAAIENEKCDSLAGPTSAKMHECFPGFGWVFGPGAGGHGHSLTLTGEGVEHRQLLALQWLKRAPFIDRWTFHAARQPGSIRGAQMSIGDICIQAKEIWVTPVVDEENERIGLTVWHPLWPEMNDKQKWNIAFLFLDEALDEYGTQSRLGEIRLANDRLAGAFPLEEMPDFVSRTASEFNWKPFLPGHSHSLFKIDPPTETFPRSDLMTLCTAAPSLFRDHREACGKLDDPLAGLGADYLYISFRKSFLPQGEEITARGSIEDALGQALGSKGSGICLGGGLGKSCAYVDLLIFDGKRSIEIIQSALNPIDLPEGSSIEFFAANNRKGRILL